MSAAAAAKGKGKASKAEKAGGHGQPSWLRGLGCGVFIMLNPASGLLLAVLLSPSVLMRVLDREPERSASRVVFLSNLAGTVGAVVALWREGVPTLASTFDVLAMPATIATAWAAAAAGWLGSELASQLALAWLSAGARRQMRDARAAADLLVAEWGEPEPGDSGSTKARGSAPGPR